MNLIEMSAAGGILILLIAILRSLTMNRLPKITFLVLWAMVLLRLTVPLRIPSAWSFYSLAEQKLAASLTQIPGTSAELPAGIDPDGYLQDNIPDTAFQALTSGADQMTESGHLPPAKDERNQAGNQLEALSPTLPHTDGSVIPGPLPVLYSCAAALLAAYFTLSCLRCRREFAASFPVTHPFALQWLRAHPSGRKTAIRQTNRIFAPLTYGILHPVILMPSDTDWSDAARVSHVLSHEFVHIRRFDALSKILLTGVLCIHWFNPFVWIMYVLANRDLEISCDESVVSQLGESDRSAYAMTLIYMEETCGRRMPMLSHFSKNALEERITAIMKHKKPLCPPALLQPVWFWPLPSSLRPLP